MRTRIISIAALAWLVFIAAFAQGVMAQEETPAPLPPASPQEAVGSSSELEQTETPPVPDIDGKSLKDTMEREAAKMNAVREEIRNGQNRGGNAAATEQNAPQSSTRGFLQWLGAFLIVLAMIVLSGYGIRLASRFAPRLMGGRSALLGGMRLGQVIGRIYLEPRASLHFVRTGGRVLVIGVTQSHISLVSEFEASSYEAESLNEPAPTNISEAVPPTENRSESPAPSTPGAPSFLSFLLGRVKAHDTPQPAPRSLDDADITALRGDIKRLQQYLKDTSGGDSNS